jgi:hypothetical protein
MNLNELTEINGKKLTKPQMNLLGKLQDKYRLAVHSSHNVVRNRVTGASLVLSDPVVGCLVEFCQVAYANYERGNMSVNGVPVAIGIFDRVKYLVLAVDSGAYSEMLD